MIDITIINDEIDELMHEETSYEAIQKLAWLFIVRDHLYDEMDM